MYEGLVKSLRWLGFMFPETHPAQDDADRMSNNIHLYCTQAANAIEEMNRRIGRAIELYNRNIEKTAMYEALMGISPEPPKEEHTDV